MATSYTSLLGLALPVTGELSGTWGDTVNNAITSLLDTAVAGTTTVSADTTLTTTSGAANQARSAIILASGHVANITITAPAQSKIYTVINASGTYTVTFRGVGPTTGITLGANEKALLAWNGLDFVRIGGSGGSGVFSSITNTSLTSGRVVYSTTGGLETDSANLLFNGTTLTANTLNLTNALGTTYGGTGLTSFTANGVVYASSTSALATGSALTFDGTDLATTGGVRLNNAQYYYGKNAAGTAVRLLGVNAGNVNYVGSIDSGPTEVNYGAATTITAQYWNVGGSEQMRLTGTGLGIGTSSPAYKLDVVTAGTSGARVTTAEYGQFVVTDGTRGVYIQNYTGLGSIGTSSNNALAFAINSVEKMRLDSSGNLGIGTTSPGATLDVNGATRIRSDFYVYGTGDRFNVFPQSAGNGVQLLSTNNANSAYSKLLFDGSPLVFNVAGSEQMRLTSTGLGIGTSSPAQKLHVVGDGNFVRATATDTFIQAANSVATFTITQSANGSTYLYNYGAYNLIFGTGAAEKMRLDSSGNLIVGGTSTALGLVSVQGTGSYDAISAETSSSTPTSYATSVIRKTSTPASGTSVNFIGSQDFKAKTQSGSYKTAVQFLAASSTLSTNDSLYGTLQIYMNAYSSVLGDYTFALMTFGSGADPRVEIYSYDSGVSSLALATQTRYDYFRPGQDNYSTLGTSGRRWTTVYATTGTINTSDRNDKQDIEELSAAEQRVAARIKGLIRKFRFKDSVAAKGDNARIHFGVIAQDVQDAFTAEGLDASRYGLFCSDTFKAIDGKPVEKDPLTQEYPAGATDYTRLGVRYDELLAFVISAI
jgi:hypothetical protein